jgi:hypothetical protein
MKTIAMYLVSVLTIAFLTMVGAPRAKISVPGVADAGAGKVASNQTAASRF